MGRPPSLPLILLILPQFAYAFAVTQEEDGVVFMMGFAPEKYINFAHDRKPVSMELRWPDFEQHTDMNYSLNTLDGTLFIRISVTTRSGVAVCTQPDLVEKCVQMTDARQPGNNTVYVEYDDDLSKITYYYTYQDKYGSKVHESAVHRLSRARFRTLNIYHLREDWGRVRPFEGTLLVRGAYMVDVNNINLLSEKAPEPEPNWLHMQEWVVGSLFLCVVSGLLMGAAVTMFVMRRMLVPGPAESADELKDKWSGGGRKVTDSTFRSRVDGDH